MGKGTIFSGGAKGRYVVSLDYGTSLRADLLSVKTDRKAALEAQITTQESEVAIYQTALDTANVSLNSAIGTYNASPKADTDKATLTARVDAKNSATTSLRKARTVLGNLELQLAHVDYDIAELNALDLTESKTVWCADYTEVGSGDVAIIEINAEKPTFVIAPGCAGYSFKWGQMIARELMTGPQAYYNNAILPGVQKHRPTFRSGVILSLDYDNSLCSVRLDDSVSSAQNLDINTATTLDNVPVYYMDCNCYAFEEGDNVVVYFKGHDPDQPHVIGFVTNPRPCGGEEVYFLVELAARVLDPATPRGDKTPGGPRTNGSYTYFTEYPGYSTFSGFKRGSEYADVSLFPPLEPTGNYDPANEDGYWDTLRIRWDVAWQKEFGANALFTTAALDVTSQPQFLDMPAQNGPPGTIGSFGLGGGFLGSGRIGYISVQYAPRWNDAGSASLQWWIPEYALNGQYTSKHHLSGTTTPCWVGTHPPSETYQFSGWTGQHSEGQSSQTGNDLFHASNWLLRFWSPPPLITIDVEGVPTEYEFVRMGGSPKTNTYALNTVPVVSPPSMMGGNVEFTTNGERELAVVYRKVP